VYINQTVVPQAEMVKYLGLHFDKRLTWKNHVATKRKQLDQKTREIYWLIGKHFPLLLENKGAHLEDAGIDGWIILRWIFRKWDLHGLDQSGSG
jgi:hypothetical protein